MDAVRLSPKELHLLAQACEWWAVRGFTYVDLPWLVPLKYIQPTLPAGRTSISTPNGEFVGSGEQSFLYLLDTKQLPLSANNKFVGWTPCLRDEPTYDNQHKPYFLKAEWFIPYGQGRIPLGIPLRELQIYLLQLVEQQQKFFKDFTAPLTQKLISWKTVRTGDFSIDIEANGIEVGSYGWRIFQDILYFYGTALALPRLTDILTA
jgi:hypothetical protein